MVKIFTDDTKIYWPLTYPNNTDILQDDISVANNCSKDWQLHFSTNKKTCPPFWLEKWKTLIHSLTIFHRSHQFYGSHRRRADEDLFCSMLWANEIYPVRPKEHNYRATDLNFQGHMYQFCWMRNKSINMFESINLQMMPIWPWLTFDMKFSRKVICTISHLAWTYSEIYVEWKLWSLKLKGLSFWQPKCFPWVYSWCQRDSLRVWGYPQLRKESPGLGESLLPPAGIPPSQGIPSVEASPVAGLSRPGMLSSATTAQGIRRPLI